MSEAFTTTGLLMAATTSVTNVAKDIAGKKVVDQHELVASTFWIRFFAAVVFAGALLVRIALYGPPTVKPDDAFLFGVPGWQLAPLPTYFIYLFIEVSLIVCSTLLFFRAMQVSPISLCMPYVSFTPVFLLVTGRIINHETISQAAMLGVLGASAPSAVLAVWLTLGFESAVGNVYTNAAILAVLAAVTGMMVASSFALARPSLNRRGWPRVLLLTGGTLLLREVWNLSPLQIMAMASTIGALWLEDEAR